MNNKDKRQEVNMGIFASTVIMVSFICQVLLLVTVQLSPAPVGAGAMEFFIIWSPTLVCVIVLMILAEIQHHNKEVEKKKQ